jgi:hypothetical protein
MYYNYIYIMQYKLYSLACQADDRIMNSKDYAKMWPISRSLLAPGGTEKYSEKS